MTMHVTEVPLAQVITRDEFQVRERLETWKVEEYASIFDRLPPVLVAQIGDQLILVDGFHRYAAARQLGRWTIPATIVAADPDTAFLMALRANVRNGLPLKTKEKKRAAERLLKAHTEWSDRWIAEETGLSDHTVASLRAELEACAQIAHKGYFIRSDGKRYECTCSSCKPGVMALRRAVQAQEVERVPERVQEQVQEAESAAEGVPGQEGVLEAEREAEGAAYEPGPQRPAVSRSVPPVHEPAPRPAASRGRGDLFVSEPGPAAREAQPAARWSVGPVTIHCADARDLAQRISRPVHLVVTSPPYNVGVAYAQHNDAMPHDEYYQMLRDVWRACYQVMVEGGRIAVVVPFGVGRNPWQPLAARVADTLTDAGFTLRGQIVWDKGTSGGRTTWGSFRLPTDPSLRDTTEAIVVGHKGPSRLEVPQEVIRHDSEGAYSPFLEQQDYFIGLTQDHWFIAPESATRIGHPAPFPVELVERLIRLYAFPGAHMLDPFAGSGTVGVAAIRLGLTADLVDIDAAYCDLARRRCGYET